MRWRIMMLVCGWVVVQPCCQLAAAEIDAEAVQLNDSPHVIVDPPPNPIAIPLKIRLVDPDLMPALPLSLQPKPGFLIDSPPDPIAQAKDQELRKAMARRIEVQLGGERMKVRIRRRGIYLDWKFD
ncbi:hypothetical protein HNQ59_001934 [Chitinivorax tropicus]|uniref:Uncharacterized protein n=1 Tax=Chitinivorax tropicus TaxID=714531 RepID=A0A840MR15_9PROT|nr:hypothetical protein [Chitinivorax tropicus]MBB5018643.1 hypothetical protein [Chitinivorax tropicus]